MRRIKHLQQGTKHKRFGDLICCPLKTGKKIASCDESELVNCCLMKEIKQPWIKAGFPVIGDASIKDAVIKLQAEYAKLRKSSNVTTFKEKINRLFDIANKNIENII